MLGREHDRIVILGQECESVSLSHGPSPRFVKGLGGKAVKCLQCHPGARHVLARSSTF